MTTRREFIRTGSGLITIVVGGLQISCSREVSVQIDAAGLGEHQVLTLVRVLQHILPHDGLDPGVYRDALTGLSNRASSDQNTQEILIKGIEALDADGAWLNLDPPSQLTRLQSIADSPFFALLRNTALAQVYNDERTWERIGYEGEAIAFGGYIDRGFNDIDWLPPVTDSEGGQ